MKACSTLSRFKSPLYFLKLLHIAQYIGQLSEAKFELADTKVRKGGPTKYENSWAILGLFFYRQWGVWPPWPPPPPPQLPDPQ